MGAVLGAAVGDWSHDRAAGVCPLRGLGKEVVGGEFSLNVLGSYW